MDRNASGPKSANALARAFGKLQELMAAGEESGPAQRLRNWIKAFVERDAKAPTLSYKFLVRQLDKDLTAVGAARIVLISPTASPQAANDATLMLSQTLANELGARVVMVDGTFGSFAISSDLGLYNRPGFADWLYEERSNLEACVLTAGHHRLSILPAGRLREDQPRAVSVERINALFAWLTERYDYVVVQQGPLASDPRYLAFASKTGVVLILAEENRTPLAELEGCLAILRRHQIANIHLILCEPD